MDLQALKPDKIYQFKCGYIQVFKQHATFNIMETIIKNSRKKTALHAFNTSYFILACSQADYIFTVLWKRVAYRLKNCGSLTGSFDIKFCWVHQF